MERRNNFICVLMLQLIFDICVRVPRDVRFVAVQRYGYGIRIAKQGTHVFLIITIFRPVIAASPLNLGVYGPVPQVGKHNKSWEEIPPNERTLKVQEREIQREINGSSNDS
jgi:hypothetical protein